MSHLLFAAYGLAAYAFFLATFAHAVGFVSGWAGLRTIDGGAAAGLVETVVVDLLLLAVFAIQHSVMARPAFKRWWTRIVPPALERSTYVVLASACLALLQWQWRPLPATVWSVEGPAATVLQVGAAAGWLLVLASTFLINHFELFGLRQSWAPLLGLQESAPRFRTPGPYRLVRHPLYLGFLFAFWCAPVMSVGHLVFAVMTTGYILLGIFLEERDLLAEFGGQYARYRQQVGMLVPRLRRRPADALPGERRAL